MTLYIGQTVGTITFATSGLELPILDMKGPEFDREWLDKTSMGTAISVSTALGNTTGVASLYVEHKEFEFTVQHDQGYPNVAAALAIDPNTGETITITAGPQGSSAQAKIVGTGVLMGYKSDMPLNGKVMTATAKLRFNSPPVQTSAS